MRASWVNDILQNISRDCGIQTGALHAQLHRHHGNPCVGYPILSPADIIFPISRSRYRKLNMFQDIRQVTEVLL